MYIAIEGIKGCGKSTVLQQVFDSEKRALTNASLFPITAPMAVLHPLELQFRHCSHRQTNDDFVEQLFIRRAYWNQPRFLQSTIIGDRSIATAIVTRWNKWQDPFYTISKVKNDYSGIMKPDVVVFIDTPVNNARFNISKRKPKLTGKAEEEKGSLEKADTIYKELFLEGLYNRKVGKTQVINLPYSSNVQDMQNEILSIINFYHQ
jgi:thymidylate kinase